ncbi:MAG: triacylglycerol lipase [Myxococcota bacterium]|jgi:triacylglycerol lipase|nr:triacylglycerol lipase [Myxococcota bacterium]MDP6244634.1 triacylglycerol lipase [Myxococcota bacterium]MDP7076421.1 triacylglycerol lipase [Myxococcota bacterium]MDP7298008.1 triacylglycerol lipase [Myxococcota bacterium]MDP7431644.1 triacylglycerol lipase [Myxococcota bacterium]
MRSARRAALTTLVAILSVGLVPTSAQALCTWWWPWGCNYTKTKYPIVLSHGLFGFDSLLGVIDYWPGIPSTLAKDGATVFVSQVSPLNSSTNRGESIIEYLEELRAITGKQKFNLIGHSQGGLDVRYVASVRPDLVASVTSVGSPHQGTGGLASALSGNEELAEDLLGALGELIALVAGSDDPQDAAALAAELSPEGIAAFNALHPQGLPAQPCGEGASSTNGIRYYSWTGTGVLTNPLDLFDWVFALTALLGDEANDGLVGQCSAHLGDVIRDDYFHNHLDEVNQLFGLVPLFETNPKSLYRTHANRLKRAGL